MREFLHELAINDVREIVDWLEVESEIVSKGFVREFRTAVAFVAKHPLAGHPCGGFRRWNLHRYPFHFLYLVSEERDELWIMVVRHDARHPSHGLQRRIPEP